MIGGFPRAHLQARLDEAGPGAQVLRVGSHRARDRLRALLGGTLPQSYFAWQRDIEAYPIPADKVEAALRIKSVGRVNRVDDLLPTMSFNDRRFDT